MARPDMLCEHCKERDATIHVTQVLGYSGEVAKHDFCETCYPAFEEAWEETWNSQPNTPPPENIENLTALEYLELSAKAVRNGVDRPAFEHVKEQLKQFPKTCQRMAFEMFSLAWQRLERREDPGCIVNLAICSRGSIDAERMPEYVIWLERIAVRCVQLYGQLPKPRSAYGPFSMTLTFTLIVLHKEDRVKFDAILEALKSDCDKTAARPDDELFARIKELFRK